VPYFGGETTFEVQNAELHIYGCDFNMEGHTRHFAVHEHSNGYPTSQETNMIRTFSQHVISGDIDQKWPEISLKTQKVLDACLLSARADGKTVELK
jgi:hypothetical protein